jgi:hypothetical protein
MRWITVGFEDDGLLVVIMPKLLPDPTDGSGDEVARLDVKSDGCESLSASCRRPTRKATTMSTLSWSWSSATRRQAKLEHEDWTSKLRTSPSRRRATCEGPKRRTREGEVNESR